MAWSSVGLRGTGVAGTGNNTSIDITPTTTIAAGAFVCAFVAKREITAVSSVTDTAGNVWTFLGEYVNVTNANIMVSAWGCVLTTQLTTSDTVTVTWGVNENDIAAAMWQFGIGVGKTFQLATGVTNPITNEVNGAVGFGSVTHSGLTNISRLFIRVLGKQVNSTTVITASANFTSWTLNIRSRNNAQAAVARAEHRIVTATSSGASNPTMAVSGNTAGLFIALEEVDPVVLLDPHLAVRRRPTRYQQLNRLIIR